MRKCLEFRSAKIGKLFLIASAVSLFSIASIQTTEAQSRRPDSRTMTCAQVQSMINQQGAVVMSTGQYTFDRYVSNRSFCQRGEVTRRDYVPTKDNNKCYVERCIEYSPFYFN